MKEFSYAERVDPFRFQELRRLNRLRKEIAMTENPLRRKLRSYIRVLQAVQVDIEKEQDRTMSPTAPITMSVSAKDSEFITLGVVIRDLTDMAYDPEFSYWDKQDC